MGLWDGSMRLMGTYRRFWGRIWGFLGGHGVFGADMGFGVGDKGGYGVL